MINQQNKIEKVCWKCKPNKKMIGEIFRMFSTDIRCIAGFVVEENSRILKVSSTIGSQGFTDIVEIPKEKIISRQQYIEN